MDGLARYACRLVLIESLKREWWLFQ